MQIDLFEQTIQLDGNTYKVSLESIKEAEPGRWLCEAWKLGPNDTWRQVRHLGRLDQLARLVRGV